MDSPSTSTHSPVNLSASANDVNMIQNLAATNNGSVGPPNLSSYGGCNSPYKMQRHHQAASRERKRVVRSAPNG